MYNKRVLSQIVVSLDSVKPPKQKKDIIVDPRGQWEHPGEVTRVPSNDITMQGVPYPVLGVDDTGYSQMMYPEQDYQYPGNYVDEYPMLKKGGSKKNSKKYSRSIEATNKLFHEHPFFKKQKSKKKKIYDPYSKYLEEGGELTEAQFGKELKKNVSLTYSPFESGMYTTGMREQQLEDPAFTLGIKKENLFPRWSKDNKVRSQLAAELQLPYAMDRAPGIKGQFTTTYEDPRGFNVRGQLDAGYRPDTGVNASVTGFPYWGGSNVSEARWLNPKKYYPGAVRFGLGPQAGFAYRSKPMETVDGVMSDDPRMTKLGSLEYGARGFVEYSPTDWLKLKLDAQAMADPISKKETQSWEQNTGVPQDERVRFRLKPGVQLTATVPLDALSKKNKASEKKKKEDIIIKPAKYTPRLQGGGIPYNTSGPVSEQAEIEQYTDESRPKVYGHEPEDYTQFLAYSATAPENRRAYSDYVYGNPDDYDQYGFWDSLGKPKDWETALQLTDEETGEPLLQPDPYDNMYHGFSINPNTGVFLKSGKPGLKPEDTTWMEIAGHYQGRDAQNYTPVFDPELGRFKYIPNEEDGGFKDDINKRRKLLEDWTYAKDLGLTYVPKAQDGIENKSFIDIDADDAEIANLLKQGYIVQELPKAQEGLITYKNNADLINSTGNFNAISNVDISPEYNDQIKQRLYTGNYGFDPNTGQLVKLTKTQRAKVSDDIKKIRAKEEDVKAYNKSVEEAGGVDPRMLNPKTTWSDKEREDFIKQGFEATVNNPVFKAAAYFTPIGAAIGSLEGLANLGPDLYKGDYTSAAFDAAEVLPFLPKALKNTYKINPWAFKPNPEAYYRMLGKEGYADAMESGVLRPKPQSKFTPKEWSYKVEEGDLYPNTYYSKGLPLDKNRYAGIQTKTGDYTGWKKYKHLNEVESGLYDGPYMVEVTNTKLPMVTDDIPGHYTSPYNISMNDPGVKFYKEHWLKGYKEVPKQLPGSPNNYTKAGFLNPVQLLDQIVPRLPHPARIPLLGANIEGLGPFTGSPLNILPGYGKTLGKEGNAYRKFGNTMEHVINTKTLSPKGGSKLRMGKDQIVSEGNWAALNKPWEEYPGTFAAEFDFKKPGANLNYINPKNRNGVLITDRSENTLVEIPISDPGLQFHRRLPFSNRYIPINKEKLLNNQFQLATQAGHLQSLAEKYGYGLGYAALAGMLGTDNAVETYNKYTIDPVINEAKRLYNLSQEYLPKKQNGGLPKAQYGPPQPNLPLPQEAPRPVINPLLTKTSTTTSTKKSPNKALPYDPNLKYSETNKRVAQNYMGAKDLNEVAANMDRVVDLKDRAAKEIMVDKKVTLDQAKNIVNQPDFDLSGYLKTKYYEDLQRGVAGDDFMTSYEPGDFRHTSFGAPEEKSGILDGGRTWDIITNPLDAFQYSVTGSLSDMPYNMREYEDYKSRFNVEDATDENLVNQALDFASWFTGAGAVGQGIKMIPRTTSSITNAIINPSLENAGIAGLNLALNIPMVSSLRRFGRLMGEANPSALVRPYTASPAQGTRTPLQTITAEAAPGVPTRPLPDVNLVSNRYNQLLHETGNVLTARTKIADEFGIEGITVLNMRTPSQFAGQLSAPPEVINIPRSVIDLRRNPGTTAEQRALQHEVYNLEFENLRRQQELRRLGNTYTPPPQNIRPSEVTTWDDAMLERSVRNAQNIQRPQSMSDIAIDYMNANPQDLFYSNVVSQAVKKPKKGLSDFKNTVLEKLGNAAQKIERAAIEADRRLGYAIDKPNLESAKSSIRAEEVQDDVNKILEQGLGIKKGDVKIKVNTKPSGEVQVLINPYKYFKNNKELIEKEYGKGSYDEWMKGLKDDWIDSGMLSLAPTHPQEVVPRTLTEIITGKPLEASTRFGMGSKLNVPTPGLKRAGDFPFAKWEQGFREKILDNLGISGELTQAYKKALQEKGYNIYSGGTGHQSAGAKRYVRDLLNNRVEIMNPKDATRFNELLNDPFIMSEIQKSLKTKGEYLPREVHYAIQPLIFRYKDKGGAIDLELTPEEIEEYRRNGYDVEELD